MRGNAQEVVRNEWEASAYATASRIIWALATLIPIQHSRLQTNQDEMVAILLIVGRFDRLGPEFNYEEHATEPVHIDKVQGFPTRVLIQLR